MNTPRTKESGKARWVSPIENEIVKFFPSNPPSRDEIVLVDGERSRVLRAKVTWEGPYWMLHKIKVKPCRA